MPRPPRPSPAPPNPIAANRLWSMQRSGRQIDCELRPHGTAGCECQMFDETWCIYRRRWEALADALADAESQRRQLLGQGWTMSG